MLGLIIPYVIGLLLGVPLALRDSRFRDRSVAYRLGVGLLASVGIAVTINASIELLDLAGLSIEKQPIVTTSEEATDSVDSEANTDSDAEPQPVSEATSANGAKTKGGRFRCAVVAAAYP